MSYIEDMKSYLKPYTEESKIEDYNYNLGFIEALYTSGQITSTEKEELTTYTNEVFLGQD